MHTRFPGRHCPERSPRPDTMRIVLFYHSVISDWNHGNAHFLRGIATELIGRGHRVSIYEPDNGWSCANLLKERRGDAAIGAFARHYPLLHGRFYSPDRLDLDLTLAGADLVIVHEWNPPDLVERLGAHRKKGGRYRLLFHDTHHRSASQPEAMAAYDLTGFDGVLAYGERIWEIYLERGWAKRIWVWHEAADIRIFHPLPRDQMDGDVVWVGNWGDDERSEEIREFLVEPVRKLGLRGTVYGVRYPDEAISLLREAGIRYGGWLPNFEVPAVFARHRLTVHIPRSPYATTLPGIPTIRPFEALGCGIPLISAPWRDTEGLFAAGQDYLTAMNGAEMAEQIRFLLDNPAEAEAMTNFGLATIRNRHTCGHRVDQLLGIHRELVIGKKWTTSRTAASPPGAP